MDHYSLMLESERYAHAAQEVAFIYGELYQQHGIITFQKLANKAIKSAANDWEMAAWHRSMLKAPRFSPAFTIKPSPFPSMTEWEWDRHQNIDAQDYWDGKDW